MSQQLHSLSSLGVGGFIHSFVYFYVFNIVSNLFFVSAIPVTLFSSSSRVCQCGKVEFRFTLSALVSVALTMLWYLETVELASTSPIPWQPQFSVSATHTVV